MSGLAGIAARWRRSGGATPPLGLHLSAESLHLVQMRAGSSPSRVRSAVSLRPPGGRQQLLGSPKDLRAWVARALREGSFRGRRVVSALPAPDLKLMVLNYPLEREEAEDEVILGLVRDRVSWALDDGVIDYLPIRMAGERRSERSSLVAVARRQPVIDYAEALRRAGLEVVALEISPVAVRRLVTWIGGGDTSRNSLVLHCEPGRCHLTVLWGRRLILYRQLDFGEELLVETLAKGLDMAADEAAGVLAEYGVEAEGTPGPRAAPEEQEIRQAVTQILRPRFTGLRAEVSDALVYTASRMRGASVDDVHLLGCFRRWPGVERLLAQLLELPVRVLGARDLRWSDGPPERVPAESDGELVVAAGLALRGVADAA